ncbi:MAG: hypothetical protein ACP5JH_08030 [Bacteroidota bacterium]
MKKHKLTIHEIKIFLLLVLGVIPIFVSMPSASSSPMTNSSENSAQDTTVFFTPADSAFFVNQPRFKVEKLNAWGINILFSENGYGAGVFYRRRLTSELYGNVSIGLSSVKDTREVEYIDPFTGETFVPGKINRFLMLPVALAVQYELFQNVIMPNFRPHIDAGIGPTLIYSSPYDREFFSSLKYGQAHYTFNAFIGAGAFFGSDVRSLSGISVRYYLIPYTRGIESLQGKPMKQFGGLFLLLDLGLFF